MRAAALEQRPDTRAGDDRRNPATGDLLSVAPDPARPRRVRQQVSGVRSASSCLRNARGRSDYQSDRSPPDEADRSQSVMRARNSSDEIVLTDNAVALSRSASSSVAIIHSSGNNVSAVALEASRAHAMRIGSAFPSLA